MQPDNIIIGDMQTGIDLPEATPEEASLKEEKKMAKYSRSTEFKKLRTKADIRIAYYRTFLPNGGAVGAEQDFEKMGKMWILANTLIAELDSIFSEYDTAAEAVEEEKSA